MSFFRYFFFLLWKFSIRNVITNHFRLYRACMRLKKKRIWKSHFEWRSSTICSICWFSCYTLLQSKMKEFFNRVPNKIDANNNQFSSIHGNVIQFTLAVEFQILHYHKWRMKWSSKSFTLKSINQMISDLTVVEKRLRTNWFFEPKARPKFIWKKNSPILKKWSFNTKRELRWHDVLWTFQIILRNVRYTLH